MMDGSHIETFCTSESIYWKALLQIKVIKAQWTNPNDLVLFTLLSWLVFKVTFTPDHGNFGFLDWSTQQHHYLLHKTQTLLLNYFPCCVIWSIKGTETESSVSHHGIVRWLGALCKEEEKKKDRKEVSKAPQKIPLQRKVITWNNHVSSSRRRREVTSSAELFHTLSNFMHE